MYFDVRHNSCNCLNVHPVWFFRRLTDIERVKTCFVGLHCLNIHPPISIVYGNRHIIIQIISYGLLSNDIYIVD